MRKPTYWICALADPSEIDLRLGTRYSGKRVRVVFDESKLSVAYPPQKLNKADAREMITPTVTPLTALDEVSVVDGGVLKLRFGMGSPGDAAFELQDEKGDPILHATVKGRDRLMAHVLLNKEERVPSIPRIGMSEKLSIRLTDENGEAVRGLPVQVSAVAETTELFYRDHMKQGEFSFTCLTDNQGDLLPMRALLTKKTRSDWTHLHLFASVGNFEAIMVSVAIENVVDGKESTTPTLEAPMLEPIQLPPAPFGDVSVEDLPDEVGLSPDMWDDTPKPKVRRKPVTPPPPIVMPEHPGADFGSRSRPFDFSPPPKRTVPLGWMVAVVIFFAGIGIAGLGELLARRNGAYMLNGAHAAFEQTAPAPSVDATEAGEMHWTIVHQRSLVADETPVASVCALRDPKSWCTAYQTDRRRNPERIVFTDCERLGETFGCSCPASIDDTMAFLSYVPNQCVKVRLPS